MQTFLNIQISLPLCNSAEKSRQLKRVQSLSIHERITQRGQKEAYNIFCLPNYYGEFRNRESRAAKNTMI